MISVTKTITFFIVVIVLSAAAPMFACAQASGELSVTPVVVDEKAKARDILKETVRITNNGTRKLNIYPSVNDVSATDGQEAFVSAQSGLERKDSLANWIELSRAVVELNPGESREIPFVIRVNLNALPGTYHADVSFYEGGTRNEAEQKNPLAVVTVNTEVQADIKEQMQLNKFVTDSFFFSGDDVLFNFQLENIGNQELKPKGEIRIYDRKGREVASVPVNPEGKSFTPEQAAQLASAWTSAQGFGKFKAFLNIDYGNNQSGSLQDTVFFWIIPWQQLLAIFVVSVIAIIVSALYFHRWLEHRHMQRFALAGLGAGMGAGVLPTPTGMIAPIPQKPIAAVMPAAIETPVKPKKRLFARLKARFTRSRSESIAQTAPAPASSATPAQPVITETAPIPAPAAPVQETTMRTAAKHTIDLTAPDTQNAPVRRVGHVINLKDSS